MAVETQRGAEMQGFHRAEKELPGWESSSADLFLCSLEVVNTSGDYM